MPITPEGRRLRARVAATTRHNPHHPDLEANRRTLKAAALERRIRDTVNADPPLTPEQRAHLAKLVLAPGKAP